MNKPKTNSNRISKSEDQPLTKGPYGFEHPDQIDVGLYVTLSTVGHLGVINIFSKSQMGH